MSFHTLKIGQAGGWICPPVTNEEDKSMRTIKRCIVVTCAIAMVPLVASPLHAQDALEMISKHLFTPDLLKITHDTIGLSPEQSGALKQEIEKAHTAFHPLKEQFEVEIGALAQMVGHETPDEQSVLEQSDRVLRLEHEIKQRHLALLIRIKCLLTPDQQARLHEIRAAMRAKQAVEAKLRKIEHLADMLKQKGGDVSVLQQLKSDLAPLLNAERFREAEAVLDKTLKQLDPKPSK